MKKITVYNAIGATETGESKDKHFAQFEIDGPEEMDASDGYHTFTELYEHRITLFIALCRFYSSVDLAEWSEDQMPVWRSLLHSDGSVFEGWFVLGIGKEKGEQITYHLPIDRWEETSFAQTLEKAPEFDGHTAADVLNRLKLI